MYIYIYMHNIIFSNITPPIPGAGRGVAHQQLAPHDLVEQRHERDLSRCNKSLSKYNYVYMCLCVYTYMHICIYAYIYIYT